MEAFDVRDEGLGAVDGVEAGRAEALRFVVGGDEETEDVVVLAIWNLMMESSLE